MQRRQISPAVVIALACLWGLRAAAAASEASDAPQPGKTMPSTGVFAFTMTTIDGRQQPLEAYRGKALLIVNTASRCGFTPQYRSLQALYER